MSDDEIRDALYRMIDVIDHFKRISKLPSCNSCGNRGCGYMPNPGQDVRINCPFWQPINKSCATCIHGKFNERLGMSSCYNDMPCANWENWVLKEGARDE